MADDGHADGPGGPAAVIDELGDLPEPLRARWRRVERLIEAVAARADGVEREVLLGRATGLLAGDAATPAENPYDAAEREAVRWRLRADRLPPEARRVVLSDVRDIEQLANEPALLARKRSRVELLTRWPFGRRSPPVRSPSST